MLALPYIILLWLHTFADFALQTDRMALNKSSSNKWLLTHVFVYHCCFYFFGWKFAIVNGLAHFVTDYITSRITSKLWKENKRRYFFLVIGIDQAIHLTTLFITFELIALRSLLNE
jgi:hypothetical protein